MNKTITISGQTIELPFTEAEYQQIIANFQSNHKQFPAKGIVYLIQDATHDVLGDSNHSDEHDLASASLAIGLHLAEKEKQGEIERLTKRIDYYENELDKINNRLMVIIGSYSL